jgi:hypothetical protein
MWKSIALLSSVVFAAQLRAEPELRGAAAELSAYLAGVPKLVHLTGEAELKVPADRAIVSLRVVTENKSLQEASRANQEIRARIMRALVEQGIPAERVKPSRFSSTPRYGVFREKAKSYRVENTVKITAHDEKEFQAVAHLVDAISEVRYESIEFEHSDKEGLKARALVQAVEKAGDKRKLYEEKLGVKLSPKAFQENAAALPTPGMPQRGYPKVSNSAGIPMQPAFQGQTDTLGDDQEMPTAFAELVFRAQVLIEYAVGGN